jgi:hypothetical protein
MTQGILYVETWPTSPEQEPEFQRWYDEVHLREVVELVPGITSARRYDRVRDDGGFVALYEFDVDDPKDIVREMRKAMAEQRFDMSPAVQMDPPPVMRLLIARSAYDPESGLTFT